MSDIVYLNGHFTPRSKAVISPDDRGFIFGDGIYEVVKYYNGKPFRYVDHLTRLERNLKEVGIIYDQIDSLYHIFEELIDKNLLKDSDAGVYLQISRGVNKRVHFFPVGMSPTVYAFSFPFPSNSDKLLNGINVVTREDIRWLRCDIKSVSLLANTMLNNEAEISGAGESVLIRNGFVTEGTHSTVFAVKDCVIRTHPLSNLILPGITRKVVLELCRDNAIPVIESAIREDELYEQDELIIAGTGSEITPVVKVNGEIIGNGSPGKITRLLQKKFFELTGIDSLQ